MWLLKTWLWISTQWIKIPIYDGCFINSRLWLIPTSILFHITLIYVLLLHYHDELPVYKSFFLPFLFFWGIQLSPFSPMSQRSLYHLFSQTWNMTVMFSSSKLCGFDVHYLKIHNTFPPYHQSPEPCFGSGIPRDWVHSLSYLSDSSFGAICLSILRPISPTQTPFLPFFSSPPHTPASTLCRQLFLEHSVQGLFVKVFPDYPIIYFLN